MGPLYLLMWPWDQMFVDLFCFQATPGGALGFLLVEFEGPFSVLDMSLVGHVLDKCPIQHPMAVLAFVVN